MKILRGKKRLACLLPCTLVLLWAVWLPGPADAGEAKSRALAAASQAEILRLGERIYREGILPSGEPMQAVVKGDIPVAGTAFSCVSCHLRSGLGSIEGTVVTPPTTGSILFKPLLTYYKDVAVASLPPRRPAYTDASLADVLLSGVDPSGRSLHDVMPRYVLEAADMAYLISYLKSLSSQFSPGATDALHFATIVSEDVGPESREAMFAMLEDFVIFRNKSSRAYGIDMKKSRMSETMLGSRNAAYLDLKLSRWVLKGPPETWRSQLEEYYRAGPVFALLGGITTGDWRPVHDFCEAHHIPSLFPVTDFPVVSDSDWYTVYLSKGYFQEGEGAARFLNGRDDLPSDRPIVEIVRDSREGRALSAGFRKTLEEMGRQAPVAVTLKSGDELTAGLLQRITAKENPAVIVLWDGPQALPALETLAAGKKRPLMVFVSSTYLGNALWTLGEGISGFTYITYPFRLPQDEATQRFFMPFLRKMEVSGEAQLALKRTYAAIQVLTRALMDMKGNYYRDYLLDVISMMPDQQVPLYERLSFGPGQRYASKGCYIVQLVKKGPKPRLIKRSDWVIH